MCLIGREHSNKLSSLNTLSLFTDIKHNEETWGKKLSFEAQQLQLAEGTKMVGRKKQKSKRKKHNLRNIFLFWSMVANSYEFNLYVFVQLRWIFILVFSLLKSFIFMGTKTYTFLTRSGWKTQAYHMLACEALMSSAMLSFETSQSLNRTPASILRPGMWDTDSLAY